MSYTLNKTGAQIDAILLRAEAGGAIDGAIALKAPLASPALTGTPTAPTAAAGTDTTQIATTEFVTDAVQAEAEADALRYAPAIVVPTSSAPVASFSDGADGVPLKSATFQIVPAQSGSGDPSPDNIRPITGWTGATITKLGKNIVNAAIVVNGYYTDTGAANNNGNYRRIEYYIPVNEGATYAFAYSLAAYTGSGYGAICYYDGNKNFIERTVYVTPTAAGRASTTFTVPAGVHYIRAFWQKEALDVQIEVGTATAYEAYNGTTYNIDWTDEAGTVYGGEIDLVSGEGTDTIDRIDLGSLTWTYSSGSQTFQSNTVSGFVADLPQYCEQYEIKSPESGNIGTNNIIRMATYNGLCIRVRDFRYTDAATFKAAVSGVYLYAQKATASTFSVTPSPISTLKGANNIWSDTGDAAVEYRADTKLYIDGQIAALQALVLENNG